MWTYTVKLRYFDGSSQLSASIGEVLTKIVILECLDERSNAFIIIHNGKVVKSFLYEALLSKAWHTCTCTSCTYRYIHDIKPTYQYNWLVSNYLIKHYHSLFSPSQVLFAVGFIGASGLFGACPPHPWNTCVHRDCSQLQNGKRLYSN